MLILLTVLNDFFIYCFFFLFPLFFSETMVHKELLSPYPQFPFANSAYIYLIEYNLLPGYIESIRMSYV